MTDADARVSPHLFVVHVLWWQVWALYLDLEESLGTVETAKASYERAIELKVRPAWSGVLLLLLPGGREGGEVQWSMVPDEARDSRQGVREEEEDEAGY